MKLICISPPLLFIVTYLAIYDCVLSQSYTDTIYGGYGTYGYPRNELMQNLLASKQAILMQKQAEYTREQTTQTEIQNKLLMLKAKNSEKERDQTLEQQRKQIEMQQSMLEKQRIIIEEQSNLLEAHKQASTNISPEKKTP